MSPAVAWAALFAAFFAWQLYHYQRQIWHDRLRHSGLAVSLALGDVLQAPPAALAAIIATPSPASGMSAPRRISMPMPSSARSSAATGRA
jgi:hypothetical protein